MTPVNTNFRIILTNLVDPLVFVLRRVYCICQPNEGCIINIFLTISRFEWMHGIKRKDINARRISLTLREINKSILTAEETKDIGSLIVETGASYNGKPT